MYKNLPDLKNGLENDVEIKNEVTLVNKLNTSDKFILLISEQSSKIPALNYEKELTFQRFSDSHVGKILKIEELRQKPSELLSTVKIDISLPAGVDYQTAQNLLIFPKNTKKNVGRILEYLNLQGDEILTLNPEFLSEKKNDYKLFFPNNLKIKSILKKFIDIKYPIK